MKPIRIIALAMAVAFVTSIQAGRYFITGHDIDAHAAEVDGNPQGAVLAQSLMRKAIGYATYYKNKPKILLITSLTDPNPGPGTEEDRQSWDPRKGLSLSGYTPSAIKAGPNPPPRPAEVAELGTYEVADAASTPNGSAWTLLTGFANSVVFSQFDAIVVASDFGGWLSQAEADQLFNRRSEIESYVEDTNFLRGLVALAESGSHDQGVDPRPAGTGVLRKRFAFVPGTILSQPEDMHESTAVTYSFCNPVGIVEEEVTANFAHNYFRCAAGLDIIDVNGDTGDARRETKIVTLAGDTFMTEAGTLDSTFNNTNGPNGSVLDVLVAPNGKIYIGGSFSAVQGIVEYRNFARLNSDGTLDTSFTRQSFAAPVQKLAFTSDGGILISVQAAYPASAYLTKVTKDGIIDSSFHPQTLNASSLVVDSNDRILVGGTFNVSGSSGLIRLNPDGTVDPTWVGIPDITTVYAVLLQTDGKILFGGSFSTVDGASVPRVARANPDGGRDTGFSLDLPPGGTVYALSIWEDPATTRVRSILVGSNWPTTPPGKLAKYNKNGETDGYLLDTTFVPEITPGNAVRVLTPTCGGQVLVGCLVGGHVVKLFEDGHRDTSFTLGNPGSAGVTAIKVFLDGKVVIGSGATTYNGTPVTRIFRLNGECN